MTINQAPFYWAICDGCGCEVPDDAFGRRLYDDKSDAGYQAVDADWHVKDDRHYCENCGPTWCLECDRDITELNQLCDPEGKDHWSCVACCDLRCGHHRNETTA